jgi:uncharacterized protein (TIGR03435 family)
MNTIQFLSAQPWVERLGWTLLHFLWQGGLIAALYALTRRWLTKSESTQLRYVLSCAALFAMVAAPAITYALTGTADSEGRASAFIRIVPVSHADIISPTPFGSLPTVASSHWSDGLMAPLVMAWAAGVVIFWARLMGGCVVAARMRFSFIRPAPMEWQETLDRLKARVRVARPVKLLVSALVPVPTVIGWIRPLVVVPVGAFSGLAREGMEALLAHELTHIRRHDYLVNLVQGAVESLLFYHPAVWWVSGRIRSEREMCCDDVAVAVSGDRLAYARALADLEMQRLAFTSMLSANGGALPERIARVLGQRRPTSRCLPEPGMLVSAVLLVGSTCLLGQAADLRPAFEVASVKPDKSETGVDRVHISNGSVIIQNVSLKRCIGLAYGVAEGRDYLFSGPGWLDTERFDISAKFPADTKDPDVLLMLQRLLDERFKLRLHREMREFSVYALTEAKGGAKLQTAAQPQAPYTFSAKPGHASGSSLSLPAFADRLGRPVFQLDRQVVDLTGLKGLFDLTLDWGPQSTQVENQTDSVPGPSIFTALQEQLGLKLEARKVPLEVLVVDFAEKAPTEN